MEKTLILGECAWSPKEMGPNVLETLFGKTDDVVPTQGNWRVLYVGMARGGWSTAAQTLANNNGTIRSGRNWRAADVFLVDLAQIDADLAGWCN